MSEQKLTVKYLPGVPEKFDKCFRVQVAHFEADLITIHGEGVFPRISLDLPRVSDQEGYYSKLALVSCHVINIKWASSRQNLSLGFLTKRDSNQSPQLQRSAVAQW